MYWGGGRGWWCGVRELAAIGCVVAPVGVLGVGCWGLGFRGQKWGLRFKNIGVCWSTWPASIVAPTPPHVSAPASCDTDTRKSDMYLFYVCVCARARACVRACACMCVCVRVCVCAREQVKSRCNALMHPCNSEKHMDTTNSNCIQFKPTPGGRQRSNGYYQAPGTYNYY